MLIPGETVRAISVGDLTLEGRLWSPPHGAAKGLGLVCHPHPVLGGDMDNKVVIHLVRALQELHFTTLRFNFRGTGRSGGEHDEGRGEQEDARAALELLRQHGEGEPCVVAGYSFGSYVGQAATCWDEAVTHRILVAPPLGLFDFGFLKVLPGKVLILVGEFDPVCMPEDASAHLGSTAIHLAVCPGADHVFTGAGPWIREQVTRFIAEG